MSVQAFITGTGCSQGIVPKPRIQMKVFLHWLIADSFRNLGDLKDINGTKWMRRYYRI